MKCPECKDVEMDRTMAGEMGETHYCSRCEQTFSVYYDRPEVRLDIQSKDSDGKNL